MEKKKEMAPRLVAARGREERRRDVEEADAPSQSSATWISDSINALGHDRRFLIG